ncbi:FecR domain-containing protein [Dyella tabacisoli]|nr:FecR domain-containing protein [Dyella tabacisoli]
MQLSRSTMLTRWSIIVLWAAGMMPLAAQATDWNYRVRPNDNIWDLSSRYLKPSIPWQKLQEYNQVADPLHLPPGMSLHIPIDWLRVQPAHASVVAVMGDAHALLPGQPQAIAVKPAMSFGYGAHLTTGPDASLTLEFADRSRVLMHGDSELDLDQMSAYGQTGMVDTRLRLQHGRVSNDVTPLSGPAAHFSVETPGTISSVRGTHFRIAADAGTKQSQAEVLTGRVDVAGGKGHLLVNKGHGVAVADGSRPGKDHLLLPAPNLHCPEQPLRQQPYAFAWPAQQGAQHYRAQLAPTARFEVLIQDRRIDEPKIFLPDLPDGDYALRIHGIDEDQLEGLDAVCTIRIDGHPQPPLVLEPQSDSKVRDTRPSFRWTESQEIASYAWQLASDADFSQLLSDQPQIKSGNVRAPQNLAYGHYYWRIASRDNSGKLGPYSAPLPFELIAEPPAPALDAPKHSSHELSLGWQPGAPGQHYRVQLARTADFAKPAVDQTVDEPKLQIPRPGSGKWLVRVQTIDTDGYAGPWSSTQTVKLPCAACRIAAAGGGTVLLWLLL